MRIYIYKVPSKCYFVVAAPNSAVADRLIREHLMSCGWDMNYTLHSMHNLDEETVLAGIPIDGAEL